MRKMIWEACDEPVPHEQLIQVYEFTRVPEQPAAIHVIRVFFDPWDEDYYRMRKYYTGKVEWYHASIYKLEEVNESI